MSVLRILYSFDMSQFCALFCAENWLKMVICAKLNILSQKNAPHGTLGVIDTPSKWIRLFPRINRVRCRYLVAICGPDFKKVKVKQTKRNILSIQQISQRAPPGNRKLGHSTWISLIMTWPYKVRPTLLFRSMSTDIRMFITCLLPTRRSA